MANDVNKSGYEKGVAYAGSLERYLESASEIPRKNGRPNISAIARAARIPRQSLYKNPACEKLLEIAVGTKGQPNRQDEARVKLERRVTALEQQNASLVAEVHELRRQLARYRHVEEMLEAGKRVIP